jgi:AraC family transcriptional regulator
MGLKVLAKIAVESMHQLGGTRPPSARHIASGDGWMVSDVVCTAGPGDQPFEEQHSRSSITVVMGGTFQYRTVTGRELMTPGAILLGNAGECFCCGHEHGTGDRCFAVSYEPEYLERLAADALGSNANRAGRRFGVPRLPPLRVLAPLVAKAATLLARPCGAACEELGIELAVRVLQNAHGASPSRATASPSSLARVTRVVRMIENEPEMPCELRSLAQVARLSPYHFLRTFEEITGATPHQYLLRVRLRRAAMRLLAESTRVAEIALACGFGDVSNFNRTFRAEFGMSPVAYRSNG